MVARSPAKPPKWHYLYFVLAALDLIAVSAGLYLSHSIMRIYVQSVEANQTWAERVSAYSNLGELAAAVNAPGNDVFDSREVDIESSRMQAAREIFDAKFIVAAAPRVTPFSVIVALSFACSVLLQLAVIVIGPSVSFPPPLTAELEVISDS